MTVHGAESVERVAVQVDRLCWAGVLLGLAFTMTNVQQFAANGAAVWSLPWCTAWLLDPMVSVVLLSILRAEQVTARHGVRTGRWVRAAKWFTLTATYVMNTWEAFTAGSPAGVVLHSVPPLVVFVAAEAVTDLRDKLGAAQSAAAMSAVSAGRLSAPEPAAFAGAAGQPEPATIGPMPASSAVRSPAADGPEKPASDQGVSAGAASGRRRRTSFAEYLAVAREARAAGSPETPVTPAWVREVTGCSRGLSSRLAAALTADEDGGAR
ncbi:hypothetical protein [Amycolatopsis rubida]|uniref:DUF2637 domain-containing protein n=1 Tax=Amycolatopsis rubida TaxID=112413 RepID=A0A1I6B3C8_9PSEU|nr:hypothetical protein [Amycolatopsis rubida]SFQ75429.1 hypothetical protein SAMN05421854_1234 [Amycolatopsis rubida]